MDPLIIRPRLLEHPGIISGMSTRRGGVSERFGMNLSFRVGDDPLDVEENRRQFFGAVGIDTARLAVAEQVHGDSLGVAVHPGNYPGCDALATRSPDVYLTITVADCLPVLLLDRATLSVANVHAGWRGTKSRIVSKTIGILGSEFGVRPADLVAFLGPSAGVCCYEVGEEVAGGFDTAYIRRKDKPHLDLKAANKDMLLAGGLLENNIEVSPYCTICNPTLFHSYRRDGNLSGRMIAVIGLKP